MYIQFNKLTNINGLINLTNIQILYMNDNQLTNVDGLINLMNINDIQMQNNNISNINGLANLKVSTRINIDSTYSGPKLASDTRFCSLNTPEVFTIGYAQKTQLCN
ncbi:MAG: hypothetical protein K2X69_09930 [Silvanigrellaceae bacterium]|nr:hypothetical protein [Silvanigrellaceae bacterium]